jgi:hypothetical protein
LNPYDNFDSGSTHFAVELGRTVRILFASPASLPRDRGESILSTRTAAYALALCALTAAPAAADVVTDWNTAALNAIRTERTPPPRASRALAILHASIYDAVNGLTRTHAAYHVRHGAPAGASKEAAAIAAGHEVLVALFTNANAIASFDTLRAAGLAAIPEGAQKASGVAWGKSVADEILNWRAADGSLEAATAPAPAFTGPGYWTPTSLQAYLLPGWGMVAPFSMVGGGMFRPEGPPSLDSAKYAAAFNEVKSLGSATSTTRTADQTEIALFWADGAGTETPPGHWNHIAQDVAAARHNTMEQNSRLFALLNIAMADAAICAWDAKYFYDFWRPMTAIRQAIADGNAATTPEAGWTSLIATPPFPDYVSGHSNFSAAAATVLAFFYRTDRVAFTTGSDFLPGVRRNFKSFSAAAREAGMSRVYGGIHFRFASDDALVAGVAIGAWTFTQHLRPTRER